MVSTYGHVVDQEEHEHSESDHNWNISKALQHVELLLLVHADVLGLNPGGHVPSWSIVLELAAATL